MPVTAPNPVPPEDEIPPPVYEVEEELIERRIRNVPVPKDRRGDTGANPTLQPDDGKSAG